MAIVDAHGKEYKEVRGHDIQPNTLLIFRCDGDQEDVLRQGTQIREEILDKNPAWKGLFLCLPTDRTIQSMPEPMLVELAQRINSVVPPNIDKLLETLPEETQKEWAEKLAASAADVVDLTGDSDT